MNKVYIKPKQKNNLKRELFLWYQDIMPMKSNRNNGKE